MTLKVLRDNGGYIYCRNIFVMILKHIKFLKKIINYDLIQSV